MCIFCALACLPYTVHLGAISPTETHPHSLFEQTWGEVPTPQSFSCSLPFEPCLPHLGPAGKSPDLFMRCLSSHRGGQVLQEPMSCWKQLGSLLRHLDQLPRGSALLWCLAKSRRSSRKLGKPYQRDGEWRREGAAGQPLLVLAESLHFHCPSGCGWMDQVVARSISIVSQSWAQHTDPASPK